MVRIVCLGIAAALLAALGGAAQAGQKIVFITDWKAEAEHGGFYEAAALGLYAKHGLDVEVRQGGPGLNSDQLIAAGAVDASMGSNCFAALNLAREGTGVKAVMAGFQKDPQILMAHPDSGVTSLEQLKGRPIMISSGSIGTFWVWLRAAFGYSDDQIRKYTFNMAPFLVDKTAVQQGYVTSEPYQVEKAGSFAPTVFLLADNGWPSYSGTVLMSAKLLTGSPQAVQGFVDATIEGWYNYLYGDPQPANALIKAANPEMTDDLLAFGLRAMKQYGIIDSGDAKTMGIGAMTDARWQTFFQLMAEHGLYPRDMDFKAAYTLQFVNKKAGMELFPNR